MNHWCKTCPASCTACETYSFDSLLIIPSCGTSRSGASLCSPIHSLLCADPPHQLLWSLCQLQLRSLCQLHLLRRSRWAPLLCSSGSLPSSARCQGALPEAKAFSCRFASWFMTQAYLAVWSDRQVYSPGSDPLDRRTALPWACSHTSHHVVRHGGLPYRVRRGVRHILLGQSTIIWKIQARFESISANPAFKAIETPLHVPSSLNWL